MPSRGLNCCLKRLALLRSTAAICDPGEKKSKRSPALSTRPSNSQRSCTYAAPSGLKFTKSERVPPGSPLLSVIGDTSDGFWTRLYLASIPVFHVCCFQRRVE